MGHQIVQQPNGLFAIFCGSTDTIIGWDYTEQDVIDQFVEQAADCARRQIQGVLNHVKAGEPSKAYFQFALTWDEVLRKDAEHGGSVALDYARDETSSMGSRSAPACVTLPGD